jgi:hypothetical protein
MKLGRWFSTAAFSLLLLVGTGAFAQDQRDDAKPAQDQAAPNQTEPRNDAKPAQDQPAARPGDGKPAEQSEDKPARGEEAPAKQNDAKPANVQSTQAAQGNRGGHIPDDKFRASFGRKHTFAIGHPTAAQGQPRFQYSGYNFTLVDAWPVGWAYTDQCYIDYIDGEYFLFDLAHPGVRLVIVVVL